MLGDQCPNIILESHGSCTCLYYSVFDLRLFMLLEWNNPDSKQFSMRGITIQHFPRARSIVLFYSQKLQAYWDLNTYLTKFAASQHLYLHATAVAILLFMHYNYYICYQSYITTLYRHCDVFINDSHAIVLFYTPLVSLQGILLAVGLIMQYILPAVGLIMQHILHFVGLIMQHILQTVGLIMQHYLHAVGLIMQHILHAVGLIMQHILHTVGLIMQHILYAVGLIRQHILHAVGLIMRHILHAVGLIMQHILHAVCLIM